MLTGQFLLAHADDFRPFLTGAGGEPMTAEEYEAYCGKVMDSAEWGGQIEVKCVSVVCIVVCMRVY